MSDPQSSDPQSGTGGQTGKPTTPPADPTPPQPSQLQAQILAIQLENEKLKSQISAGEVQAGQLEQKPSAEQQKAIDELTTQLTEVYLNEIKPSKLYTDDELKLMDVNQLKATAEVVRRQKVLLAKQGSSPSSTELGLTDSLTADSPGSSKPRIKEPFNYNPKDGTWKG